MRWSITSSVAAGLAVVLSASSAPSGAAQQTPQEFAQALQKKYDAVKAFSAEFVQTYRGGVLNTQLTERGRLLVKKPGRMRWEYTSPEKKLFVSDGLKIYFYVPDDRQVTVTSVPRDNQATTPALFLAGKGNLARDFTASLVDAPPGAAPGSRALKLVPKASQPDYDWLTIVVEPATLKLRGLMYGDPQGGTTVFSFVNLKENPLLADKAFDFKPPRGVDVVTASPLH